MFPLGLEVSGDPAGAEDEPEPEHREAQVCAACLARLRQRTH
jgi:hypothetical protein